jgi:hypothetical protein
MATNEMVWKYCNLKNKQAAILALPGLEVDNIKLVGQHYLECCDLESDCTQLGCKFASGTIDPFALPA